MNNPPFKLLAIETDYEIVGPDAVKHVYTKRDNVSPLYPSRFYERRFRWSGTETRPSAIEVTSETDGIPHKVHGPQVREDDDVFYLIDLGAHVAPARKLWIETRQVLHDEGGTFRPYLRHRVAQQTGRLRLKVTLPENLDSNFRVFYADEAARTRHSVPRQVHTSYNAELHSFELEVVNPKVGFIYGIDWL